MTRRSRRGAAAMELALTAPVLMAIGVATVELGFALGAGERVAAAAHEGARAAAGVVEGAAPDGARLVGVAEAAARDALADSGVPCGDGCTIVATWAEDAPTGLWFVDVRVTAPWRAVLAGGVELRTLTGRAVAITDAP